MPSGPSFTVSAFVLGSPDAKTLADFYRELLSWDETFGEPGWVMLKPPGAGAGLSFQTESDYRPPTWPERPGEQQMMAHLDIRVDDLAAAGARAIALGATLCEHQPQDDVRVYLDPAGHPFCLFAS